MAVTSKLDVCTWSNGMLESAREDDDSQGTFSAYTACAGQSTSGDEGEDETLGHGEGEDGVVDSVEEFKLPSLVGESPRSNVEYSCPENMMQDAMRIPGGEEQIESLCSQVCLPHALWAAAQDRGVTRGKCANFGYSKFEYSQVAIAGVHYNVYSVS